KAAPGPGLFPGTHFPASGKQKGLVILVEYKDVKMTLSNPYDYFYRMLNEEGFSSYGGTGSARDFFLESSMGQFDPEFDVYGPVTLSQNRAYYGGNGYSGDDQRPADMVKEACDLLDGVIDFSQYDRDGDGEVDNVFVFYAGRGEASGGPAESVWPHAWNVEYGIGYQPEYDGVRVSRYACSNEYESGRPDGVGTFIHEFSHVMGLPDLYATSYTSSFTPGAWSCMDYGPYNNNGCTPPLYGAFERYALGWMEPLEVSVPVNATLEPIGTNMAGIIKTPKANEFFLIENRQKVSWDRYIPGHGMLVWHIDYNESVWNSNKVNNTPSHQYVDIEEADGTQSESSRAGDAFPGTSNKTSFTDTGTPNMKTWSGQALEKPLTDIAENGGIITFKALGGRDVPLSGTVALEAPESDDESFTAAWKPVADASYRLSVYTRAEGSDAKQYLPGYDHKNVGTATTWRIEGLEAGNTYFYTVAVSTGWEQSEESNEITVTTGPVPLNKIVPEILEAEEVSEHGFTARWTMLDIASDYLLSVYVKEMTGTLSSVCDFTDGVSRLPEGWAANTAGSYAMESYSGKAIPSLRLGKTSDRIESPLFGQDIHTVTFWHRGNGSGASDGLTVSVLVDGKWQSVAEIPVVTALGGTVSKVDVSVPGARQARIELKRNSGKGAVAIDDIEISYGVTSEDKPLKGYDSLSTGNIGSLRIEGLAPATTYWYRVTATDGTLLSRPSAEMQVVTVGESGIADIAANDSFTVSGLTVVTDGALASVYDIAGRLIGRGTEVVLPSRGVYIVSTPSETHKIVL
ncbi:MAG: M6 family metalloprotease domain-containing protein, partial [Duncaniella sp.]|nr:M6 family metalloprotease domain-containing protein [Duncaniella sp.]